MTTHNEEMSMLEVSIRSTRGGGVNRRLQILIFLVDFKA